MTGESMHTYLVTAAGVANVKAAILRNLLGISKRSYRVFETEVMPVTRVIEEGGDINVQWEVAESGVYQIDYLDKFDKSVKMYYKVDTGGVAEQISMLEAMQWLEDDGRRRRRIKRSESRKAWKRAQREETRRKIKLELERRDGSK